MPVAMVMMVMMVIRRKVRTDMAAAHVTPLIP